MNSMIGAQRLAVNSGTTCAKVGSIESVRSQMMFLSAPEGIPCTVPSGKRDSLSTSAIRTLPISLNVILCEVLVDNV